MNKKKHANRIVHELVDIEVIENLTMETTSTLRQVATSSGLALVLLE